MRTECEVAGCLGTDPSQDDCAISRLCVLAHNKMGRKLATMGYHPYAQVLGFIVYACLMLT